MPMNANYPTPDAFTRGYIVAALWSSIDENGQPLDSIDAELSGDTRAQMLRECAAFQAANAESIEAAHEAGFSDDQLGHDFWLTRNGHGTGFWDRENLPLELQKALTDAARAAGEVDLYVSDDGEICQLGGTPTHNTPEARDRDNAEQTPRSVRNYDCGRRDAY